MTSYSTRVMPIMSQIPLTIYSLLSEQWTATLDGQTICLLYGQETRVRQMRREVTRSIKSLNSKPKETRLKCT